MRGFGSFLGMALMVAAAACSGGEGEGTTGDGGSGAAGAAGGGGATEGGGGSTGGSGGGATTTSDATGGSGGGDGGSGAGLPETGCETAGSEPVSFANDVQPILQQSCGTTTTCHLKGTPSGGLSLKTGQSYAELVNQTSGVSACTDRVFVAPGHAAQSYLVDKLTETGSPAICGKRMPYNKAKLPAATIQTIVDWICQGAPDN